MRLKANRSTPSGVVWSGSLVKAKLGGELKKEKRASQRAVPEMVETIETIETDGPWKSPVCTEDLRHVYFSVYFSYFSVFVERSSAHDTFCFDQANYSIPYFSS